MLTKSVASPQSMASMILFTPDNVSGSPCRGSEKDHDVDYYGGLSQTVERRSESRSCMRKVRASGSSAPEQLTTCLHDPGHKRQQPADVFEALHESTHAAARI